MENLTPGLHYHTWLDGHMDVSPVADVQKLADCLPHGSGIDHDWTIVVSRNGDLVVYGSYHQMNEHGYNGWKDFRFTIRKWRKPNKIQPLSGPCLGQFQVTKVKDRVYLESFIGGGSDNRDYLYDTVSCAISDALGIHAIDSQTFASRESAEALR